MDGDTRYALERVDTGVEEVLRASGAFEPTAEEGGEPEVEQPLDGIAFGWAGVGSPSPARRVVDITISGGDVDVAGHDRASLCGVVLLQFAAKAFEPHEFVEVVRIVECSPVGSVDRPAPDTSAGRGDEAGLIERGRDRATETPLHIVDADPTGDRNAIPVVDAVVNDVVARLGEGIERKVVVTALGFLQEHHVGRPIGRPGDDLIDPGADRVDVPRGDPHPSGPYAGFG